MIRTFEGVLIAARDLPESRIAVAGADDAAVIEAIRLAEEEGLSRALLFGDAEKIRAEMSRCQAAPAHAEIIQSEDSCASAVDAVSGGMADCVLKGNVATNAILKAVLKRDAGEAGVRKLISHVAIIENPPQNRLLICTDGGMVIDPDAGEKAAILDNALVVAHAIGVERPKVGLPALMEDKGQDIKSLNDARELMAMHKGGRWEGIQMDGPFGVDVFLDREAAEHKRIKSALAGEVDILLFPNTDACNLAVKMVLYYCSKDMIGLVVGGLTPVILVSRAHSPRAKLISIALAKLVGQYQQGERASAVAAGAGGE